MTGALPPVAGALLQEAIDVIVILNALRALSGGLEKTPKIPGWTEISIRLRNEHRELAPSIARIRALADGLGSLPPVRALRRAEADPVLPDRDADPARGGRGPRDLPAARERGRQR